MIGTTISHYKILEKLGEGGMGVVYKAEDTQLRRTVALKFLPRETFDDTEVRARLMREAQAAASLDHPNICQVFGIHEEDGETFIAMAYVDGPALADKIKERPLPLEQALSTAIQIAEALHEAHEQGVVHRDIKPQNILLTAKGQVKILDFGLASLTGRSKLTKTGTTLGTPAYMAPEQLEGREVDRRADVWALGCVLYEMLAQRTPFEADYEQAIAYGILNEDPEPISAQRADVTPEVDRVLEKALAKEPGERYQHADDLLADLRVLQKQGSGARKASSGQGSAVAANRTPSPIGAIPPGSVVVQRSSQRLLQVFAAVLGIAFLGLLAIHFMAARSEPLRPVRSFSFSLEGLTTGNGGQISPDGKHILYVAGAAGQTSLWLHSLENESVRELSGTQGAVGGFWSPDSLSIGFGTDNDELKRLSLDGGNPTTLCGLLYQRGIAFAGGTWSPDGETIVFSSSLRLFKIAARGGEPQMLFGRGDGSRSDSRSPHFLPSDGGPSALIYSATAGDADRWVAVLNLETGERKELGPGFAAVYSAEGHLIHGHSNASQRGLWALPFDRESLSVTDEAFPIAGVGQLPSVSRDGALAYWDGAVGAAGGSLVWRNRAGEITGTVGEPQPAMRHPAISPDGQRIAVTTDESGNPDIWVHDLIRSTKTRFTFFAGDDRRAIWSPSGDEITFRRAGNSRSSFLSKAADGTGEAVVLVESEASIANQHWSQDGEYLIYQENPNSESRDYDIRYTKFQTNGESSEPVTFLTTPASELVPEFSPDGRFVAYVSTYLADGAEHRDVYVRPFPDGSAGTWQVSLDGGTQPHWRGDGTELYYVKNGTMMAVPVSTETGFTWDRPRRLFESVDLRFGGNFPTYDVSADGQRFLTIKPFFADETETPKIRIVLNWYEAFRDRE